MSDVMPSFLIIMFCACVAALALQDLWPGDETSWPSARCAGLRSPEVAAGNFFLEARRPGPPGGPPYRHRGQK